MAEPLKTRDRAWDDYNRTVEQIRNDHDLTADAKSKRLASAWHKANTAIGEAHASLREEREARRRELTDSIFNPARSSSLSPSEKREIRADYRDALFRAESIESEERAAQVLDRAQKAGDSLLVRAVGVIALEKGWPDVTATVASSLGEEKTIEELLQIESAARDVTIQFHEGMVFEPPAKPTELETLSDYRIQEIAEEKAVADARSEAEGEAHRSVSIP